MNRPTFTLSLLSAAALLCLALFWTAGLYRISDIPGIYNDEIGDVAPAFYASLGMELDPGTVSRYHLGHIGVVRLSGLNIPLTIDNNRGFLESYLLYPFIKVFGIDISVTRTFTVFIAFAALLVFTLGARNLFGARASLIALIMGLSSAPIIIHSRFGVEGGHSMLWLGAGAAFLFLSLFERTASALYLYAASFVLGLVTYNHVTMLGAAVGMTAGAFLFLESFRRLKGRTILVCFALFLAGYSPYWIAQAFNGFEKVKYLAGLFSANVSEGPHAALIISNLLATMDSTIVQGVGNIPFFFSVVCWLPLASLTLLLVPGIRARLGDKRRYVYVLLFTALVYLTLVGFRVTELRYAHVLLVLPLLITCAAVTLNALWDLAGARAALAVCLVLASMVLVNASILTRYFGYYLNTGGRDTAFGFGPLDIQSMDAQKSLSGYLLRNGFARPIALCWNTAHPIVALTHGKVIPVETPFLDAAACSELLENESGNVFIRRFSDPSKSYATLKDAALARGYSESDAVLFSDRSGAPVFSVFTLKKTAQRPAGKPH